MPELPEVEFARSCLTRWLVGERLREVEADQTRLLRGSSMAAVKALSGHRMKQIHRKGKWLLWELDGGLGVLSHLGMTGKFVLRREGDALPRASRVRLTRADGATVHLQDQRLFGLFRAGPIEALQQDATFSTLGPDAWDAPMTATQLREAFANRKRAVKDVLMDQAVIAGIGNIQATEALWKAGIHPSRPAGSLEPAECTRLLRALHWTLKRTMAMNTGDEISYVEEDEEDNPFRVYARAGEACPKCSETLAKLVIGGRTSAYCPQCQPMKPRR